MESSLVVPFKEKYLRLIASGYTESKALAALNTDWFDFFELCAKDPDFRKDIDLARKGRAEKWVNMIAESVNRETPVPPAEVPAEKLKFEQLKFLAKADNPERYGDVGGKAPAVQINMNDFKLLPPNEAIRVLNNDPFNKLVTIDAEVEEKKEE